MRKSASPATAKATSPEKKRKARTQPVAEAAAEAVAIVQEKAQQQRPKKKIVDILLNALDIEAATDKAQLIIGHDDKGNRYKFWLPKSQITLLPDGDNPAQMICRLAAWLYYRSGMKDVYPVARWSTAE